MILLKLGTILLDTSQGLVKLPTNYPKIYSCIYISMKLTFDPKFNYNVKVQINSKVQI
jgi:hypothetical protein